MYYYTKIEVRELRLDISDILKVYNIHFLVVENVIIG